MHTREIIKTIKAQDENITQLTQLVKSQNEVIKNQADTLTKIFVIFEKIKKIFDFFTDAYDRIRKNIIIINFILGVLIFKVFLYDLIISFFSRVKWWSTLSEGWKIAIVSLIFSIPIGIFVAFISNYTGSKKLEDIKEILEKIANQKNSLIGDQEKK